MVIRYILSLFIGFSITIGLFWFMNLLINGKMVFVKSDTNMEFMNFIRVKQESKIQPKKRDIPKEPKKPPKKPPKPKISTKAQTQISQKLDIKIPKISMDLNLANNGLRGAKVSQALGSISNSIAINLMPIFKIPPRYPNRAKILKKEGSVTLEFTITKKGLTSDIKVIKANPPKLFNKSAIKALSKWKFKPKIVAGKAVSQKARQSIDYKLR